MTRRTEGGFTLIELLVVVLILGVLMAIAIPTFLSLTSSSRERGAESNVSIALTDESAFYTQNSAYGTVSSSPAITTVDAGLNWSGTLTGSTGKDKVVYAGVSVVGPSAAVILGELGSDAQYYWALESQSLTVASPLYLVTPTSTPPAVSSFVAGANRTWVAAGG